MAHGFEPSPEKGLDPNDLKNLAQSQNYQIKFHQEADAYYSQGRKPNPPINLYQINFDVYAVHDFDEEEYGDYYYVEQTGIYSVSNAYVPPYKYDYEGALSKVEEWYLASVTTNCYLNNFSQEGVTLITAAPQTTQHATQITTGLDWHLSGTTGYIGEDSTVQISGGVNVANSATTVVDDVSVENLCRSDYAPSNPDSSHNAKWQYSTRRTACHFSMFSYGQVELDGCSSTAHSTLFTYNSWIWRCTGDALDEELALHCDYKVTLGSSRGRTTVPTYTDIAYKEISCDQNSPAHPCNSFVLRHPPRERPA